MSFLKFEKADVSCYQCECDYDYKELFCYYFSVMRLDGSTPTKYGLRLNMDEKYKGLKKQLSQLTSIPMPQILLVEIFGALVKVGEVLYFLSMRDIGKNLVVILK